MECVHLGTHRSYFIAQMGSDRVRFENGAIFGKFCSMITYIKLVEIGVVFSLFLIPMKRWSWLLTLKPVFGWGNCLSLTLDEWLLSWQVWVWSRNNRRLLLDLTNIHNKYKKAPSENLPKWMENLGILLDWCTGYIIQWWATLTLCWDGLSQYMCKKLFHFI